MSELDTVVSTREAPWRRIGTPVPEGVMTAKEALQVGGLDWTVHKVPAYAKFEGRFAKSDQFALVRGDTRQVFGFVGRNYVPFQNDAAFTFFDNLVDSGDAKYEVVGSFQGGRRVWLTAKPPEGVQLDVGEAMEVYLLLSTSHDGRQAITVSVVPYRVDCANILNFAISSAQRQWRVRHTSSAEANLAEARQALGLTFEYLEEFEVLVRQLQGKKLSSQRFKTFLSKLAPDVPQINGRALDGIQQLFNESPSIVGTPAEGTAWGAINAVGEYFDWVRPRDDEARVLNTFVGGIGAKARDNVLAALVSLN